MGYFEELWGGQDTEPTAEEELAFYRGAKSALSLVRATWRAALSEADAARLLAQAEVELDAKLSETTSKVQ